MCLAKGGIVCGEKGCGRKMRMINTPGEIAKNYIETGNFVEKIFPFMGVRFIAVGDGYDSADYEGTTGGIEIAFRSFLL